MKNAISRKFPVVMILFLSIFLGSCSTSPGKKTAIGAGIGAVAGGAIGALATKGSKKGILVGAALGGGLGALIGNRLDAQKKELEKIAETKRTEQGLVTKLKGDLLFDSGKTALNSKAKTNITKISEIIKKYPEDVITVIGHTDSQGGSEMNQSLSEKRAEEVRNFMVSKGVKSEIITAVGRGENAPIADNKTASGRSKNRRVELLIEVDPDKVPKS